MFDALRIEGNRVVLCGDKICCPTMEKLPDGRYMVIDDDGKAVILTAEQIKLMTSGVKLCDELSQRKPLSEQQLICE